MDVVYPLKDTKSSYNDWEIRYSLRSLRHFKADTVWIVTGKKRPFLKNVKYIKCEDGINRWENGRNKILSACHCPDVSDPFLMMHDDIYLTKDIGTIPHYYSGTIEDRITGNNSYSQRLRDCIKFSKDGLNYSLHIPLIVHKDEFIQHTREGALARNLYCSWSDHPKEEMKDVKLRSRKDHKNVKQIADNNFCFSSSDFSYRFIWDYMKELYPDKSRWEV